MVDKKELTIWEKFTQNLSVKSDMDGFLKDGCEFVDSLNVFLSALDCPHKAREFVIAVVGLSHGVYDVYIRLTDAQIAERMGISERTVRRRRELFKEWAELMGISIIDIKQGEFDEETNQFLPTEYKVTVSFYLGQFCKLARERYAKPVFKMIERGVEYGLQQIAAEVALTMPEAEFISRTKRGGQGKRKLGKTQAQLESAIVRPIDAWFDALCPKASYTTRQNFCERVINALNGYRNKRKGSP